MIEFQTFGKPELAHREGLELGPLADSPKLITLLAYLALTEPGQWRSRGIIRGLFWPEVTETHARGSLNQAIYSLRGSLGQEAIPTQGEDGVALNGDLVRVDAVRFRLLVDEADNRAAIDLYRGEFLHGVALPGNHDLEDWVEDRRQRFRRQAVAAMLAQSESEEGTGNVVGALRVAVRAMAVDPLDERLAERVVRLRLDTGDRSGAAKALEVFRTRLARDLDLEPSALFDSLEERIRDWTPSQRDAPQSDSSAPPITVVSSGAGDPAEVGTTPVEPTSDLADGPSEHEAPPPVAIGGRRWSWAALVVFSFAILAALVAGLARDSESPVLQSRRVLVVPFENVGGDPELESVGFIAADWISQELAATGLLEVVPGTSPTAPSREVDLESGEARGRWLETARKNGAGLLIEGSYVSNGTSLAFQVRVIDVESGELLWGHTEDNGSPVDPMPTVEELRRRVSGAVAALTDPRIEGWAQVASQPPTFEAYQAYAEGIDQFRQGRPALAAATLRAAAAADSSFTAPLIWAIWAHHDAGSSASADSLVRSLEGRKEGLPAWDREMLSYLRSVIRGEHQEALAAAERVVAISPAADWQVRLATEALWAGQPTYALEVLSRLVPPMDLAFAQHAYLFTATGSRHMLGDFEGELRVACAHAEGGGCRAGARALAAMGHIEQVLEVARIERERSAPNDERALSFHSHLVRELQAHGQREAASEVLEEVFAWSDRGSSETLTEGGRIFFGDLLQAAGRYDEARAMFEDFVPSGSAQIAAFLPLGYLGVIAAQQGRSQEALEYEARLSEMAGPYLYGEDTMWRASILANLDRVEEATELFRQSVAEGLYQGPLTHVRFGLDPLRGHPRFDALAQGIAPAE